MPKKRKFRATKRVWVSQLSEYKEPGDVFEVAYATEDRLILTREGGPLEEVVDEEPEPEPKATVKENKPTEKPNGNPDSSTD